jgi:hypothetical protein
VLPNNPHTQHNQGVETLPKLLLLHPHRIDMPPALKGIIRLLRHQGNQAHQLKEVNPKLPSKDARDQEVVNILGLLATKRATLKVIEASRSKLVSGLASIVFYQRDEKFTLAWSPGFPNSLSGLEEDGSLEHGNVGQLGRELASQQKLPYVLIRQLRVKINPLNFLVQLKILHQYYDT